MTNVRSNSTSRARPPKKGRGRTLRGRGDYSEEVTNEPNQARRMEKKLDHIERVLQSSSNPKKASINQAASMAGRALGTAFGQGDLGAFAGDRLARLFGHGDYRVSVKGNSLMSGLSGPTIPKFSGDGKRGVRLTEREFLGNVACGTVVTGSSAFSNQTFSLNPNDPQTFPWLSRIAGLFDQWEPHGIVFEFITTSSTFNGTSQALGAVIMATDYDAETSPYETKQEMENADYACSSVPSANLVHGVECDPNERPLPVLYTTLRSNLKNFSSLGNFQIATQGCSVSDVVLGELWISYDITFYKKQLVNSVADVPFIVNKSEAVAENFPVFNSSSNTDLRLFRTVPVVGLGTDVFFPPSQGTGYFQVLASVQALSTFDPGNLIPEFYNCQIQGGLTPENVIDGVWLRWTMVKITAPGAKLRFGVRNSPGTGNYCFTIVEVPSTLFLNPFVL